MVGQAVERRALAWGPKHRMPQRQQHWQWRLPTGSGSREGLALEKMARSDSRAASRLRWYSVGRSVEGR